MWKNTDQSSFEYGHFLHSVIFYLASPIYCVKYWKVSCCIFSQYCKTIFWTSSKSFKLITKVRRHCSVPRGSILNISYKCIFIVLFSVSFNHMFVWNTKELGSLYSSILGKTSQRHRKTVRKWLPEGDALGTSPSHQFWT